MVGCDVVLVNGAPSRLSVGEQALQISRQEVEFVGKILEPG